MTERLENKNLPSKVVRLTEQLEKKYGLSLSVDSVDHLMAVREHYIGKRNFILSQRGVAGALESKDYSKAVLISEAISLILREIGPTRTRKRTEPRKDRK